MLVTRQAHSFELMGFTFTGLGQFGTLQEDGCEQCISTCCVLAVVGRPYGLCDPHCGAADMVKPLV